MSYRDFSPFDAPYDSYDRYRYDEPPGDPNDQLTHLVFVRGRLLEAWTEPVRGTRWQRTAEQLDPERTPPIIPTPAPPPPPLHVTGADWLSDICGGPDALDALDTVPLTGPGEPLRVEDLDLRARHRLESAVELIEARVTTCFEEEAVHACHTALQAVWRDHPEVVRSVASPAHLVGGICWAVGKANGCYGPRGTMTHAQVQTSLALTSGLTPTGQKVAAALRGIKPRRAQPCQWRSIVELEPLGRTDLLTSRTRRQLIALRDQVRADAAREAAGATAGATA